MKNITITMPSEHNITPSTLGHETVVSQETNHLQTPETASFTNMPPEIALSIGALILITYGCMRMTRNKQPRVIE